MHFNARQLLQRLEEGRRFREEKERNLGVLNNPAVDQVRFTVSYTSNTLKVEKVAMVAEVRKQNRWALKIIRRRMYSIWTIISGTAVRIYFHWMCTFATLHVRTFFSLAAICLFLFTWLLAMLANFRATVLGRLIGMECLSDPCTGGTISMAVMHSSPACFVTIFILDHLEVEFTVGSVGFAAEVPTGFAASCAGNPKEKWLTRPVAWDFAPSAALCHAPDTVYCVEHSRFLDYSKKRLCMIHATALKVFFFILYLVNNCKWKRSQREGAHFQCFLRYIIRSQPATLSGTCQLCHARALPCLCARWGLPSLIIIIGTRTTTDNGVLALTCTIDACLLFLS